MTYEDKQELEKIQNESLGSWYEVTYIPDYMDFQCPTSRYQEICKKTILRLNNMNGWGIGTVLFITEDNKVMVLHWRSIIAMIPVPIEF